MKLRRNKKGFTIIELVIVIAVIGILAAVLIPTFVNLTSKANEASDNALINNLNKALKIEEQEAGHKKAETLEGAIVDLEKQGYILENLVTKSGKELIWSQSENQFLTDPSGKEGENYWKIVDAVPTNLDAQKYSYYAGQNFNDTSVTVKYGFDAGRNDKITTVTYQRSGSGNQTVSIRTLGGNLVVNAQNDSVKHYGNLNNLTVTAVYNESYHENGIVAVKAELVRGKLEVGTEGYIKEIDTTNAVSGASLVVDGFVSKVSGTVSASSGTGYVVDNNGVPMGNPSALDTNISSVAELLAFRDKVNNGYSYSNLTVKLAADLDISNIPWAPIGNNGHSFIGTFDGQKHTITGLTNKGYSVSSADIFTTDHANTTGAPYGFFGVIGGSAGTTVTIKDLTLKNINIDMSNAGIIGGLFAADPKSAKVDESITDGVINIENIDVYGQITSTNKSGISMGGVAGKVYNPGRNNFKNCNSYVNMSSTEATGDLKVSGVIGFAANGTFVVSNCNNYGNVTLSTAKKIFTAGIITKSSGNAYVKGCKAQGKFDLETTGSDNRVYFSVIARGQNAANEDTGETELFEGTTYNIYDNEYPATSIRGANCSISSDSSYDAFKATIKDNDNTLEITSSYEGLDMFKLYNNYPNYL